MRKISLKYIYEIVIALVVYLMLVLSTSLVTDSYTFRHSEGLIVSAFSIIIMSNLCDKSKAYISKLFTFTLLLCSIVWIKMQPDYTVEVGELRKYLAFVISFINITVLLLSFIKNSKIRFVMKAIFNSVLLLPVIVFWAYYFITGTWFTTDSLLAILQTNISESQEYITNNVNIKVIAFGFIAIVVCYFYSRYSGFVSLRKMNRKFYFATFCVLILCLFCLSKYRNNIVTEIPRQAFYTISQYKSFNELREGRRLSLNKIVTQNAKNANGVFVLVIGESQSKDHMSAYGYKRVTTPWLDKEKNTSNMILFNNAYSCHVHTVPTLSYALTAQNQYNIVDVKNAYSLLEVAEAVDFDTVWLSNQVKYSAWDTPLTFIADEANQQKWINSNIGETTSTDFFDDALVKKFDELKYSPNMLVVVHLMGNHELYNKRYPKEFVKFNGGKANVDNYDNSILYNDYVMSKILARAKQIPNFQGLIYCADHADAVDKNLAHNASQFDADMTHIPLYIYLSDTYIGKNPTIYKTLRESQDKYFTNDLLFNLVLGVMNVNISELYEAENDLTSSKFDNNRNRFTTLYGDRKIQ